MREPSDLGSAIEVMQKELRHFELSFSICGVAIVDETSGKVRTIGAFPDAEDERLMMEISSDEVPELQSHMVRSSSVAIPRTNRRRTTFAP
jgi:hypothetical protein